MATIAHPCFALDCLVSELSKKDAHSLSDFTNALSRSTAQDAIIKTQTSAQALTSDSSCPLFVTYNTLLRDGSTRLRGCIGTFSGGPLEQTIKQYALIAALQDTRFSPIRKKELETLECCVSVLTDFEDIEDPLDWTLGTHGVQIYFTWRGRGRSATFLPDVAAEQGWTKDETMEHLLKKGGWDGGSGPNSTTTSRSTTTTNGTGREKGTWRDVMMDVQRYQSTKATVSYTEYLKIRADL